MLRWLAKKKRAVTVVANECEAESDVEVREAVMSSNKPLGTIGKATMGDVCGRPSETLGGTVNTERQISPTSKDWTGSVHLRDSTSEYSKKKQGRI